MTDSEHLEMLLEVVASLAENGEHSSFVYVVANQKWLVNMGFFMFETCFVLCYLKTSKSDLGN